MINVIELSQALINQQSVTPDDNGCQKIISQHLKKLGFQITHLDQAGVTNTWAQRSKAEKPQPLFVFSGHTDTVPAGDLNLWRTPPFTATIQADTLYGRGAADMKSALAAIVCAYQQFLAQYPEPLFDLGLMLTSDEEGEATDGTDHIVKYLQSQNITPDWCLIGEATSSQQFADTIKIGRRGSLHGFLEVIGKQGHVAYPQLADNPIHKCFQALDSLTKISWDNGNEFFSPSSFQIYHINADTGASNMTPGSLNAQFNFRFNPCVSPESLQQRVTEHLNKAQLQHKIQWQLSSMPFLSTPGVLTKACKNTIKKHCGIETQLSTDGGTSDGRFIARTGCEIVELGPINKSIHQVNEQINLDDLKQLTTLYCDILIHLQQHMETQQDAILANEIRT
jgi:succinyl-diaminopimelate desuccinylase